MHRSDMQIRAALWLCYKKPNIVFQDKIRNEVTVVEVQSNLSRTCEK